MPTKKSNKTLPGVEDSAPTKRSARGAANRATEPPAAADAAAVAAAAIPHASAAPPPSSDSAEAPDAAAEGSRPTRRATRGASTRAAAAPGGPAAREGGKKVLGKKKATASPPSSSDHDSDYSDSPDESVADASLAKDPQRKKSLPMRATVSHEAKKLRAKEAKKTVDKVCILILRS